MLSLLVEFDKINTKHWGDLVVYMGTEDLCLNHCSLQHLLTGGPLILLTHFKALFMIVNVFCLFFVFVALRPMSTAMVIAGRSVHLTTLFLGRLEQAVNQ